MGWENQSIFCCRGNPACAGVSLSLKGISMRAFKSLIFVFLAFTALAVSGCTLGSLSPEQVQATAHDLAATGIVQTLTAMSTNTTLPSATPLATNTATPEPTLIVSEEPSLTPTLPVMPIATVTPFGQSGNFDQDKDNKSDKNAPLALVNASSEHTVKFALLTPYYTEYEFNSSMSLILAEGEYTYRVWVDKKVMNGSFRITNGDKHVLTIRDDRVNFATP
jgi:hypothetical protein